MKIILELAFLTGLLLLAALTAASEISIIASSRIKLKRLAYGGSKAARIILKILDAPEKLFGTILVVNNIVDTLIAVIVAALIIRIVGGANKWSITLSTVIASFLIIIFEVTTKTFAAWHSEKMASVLARPVKFLIVVFTPVVKIFEFITNIIVKILGGQAKGKSTLVTEDEIRALIKIGGEEGVLHKEKYKMLSKVFDFSETVTRDVMTAKKDMVCIDINSNFDDILARVLETGYSRFPVYKDNPDNIVGIMNMKDLLSLSCNRDLVVLHDILYPATFVPAGKNVAELLREFQKGHTHIALVVDDRNNILGLVTLEDLLEEIVGEIEDEYDIRGNHGKK